MTKIPVTEAPPLIFDRQLRRLRQTRLRDAAEKHVFLLERVAEEMAARLQLIKRDFKDVLVIGARSKKTQQILEAACGQANVHFADLAPGPEGGRQDFVGDEEFLPVGREKLDLVISLLDLHAVNDLPGALVLIRQSLRPDGLFLGALFGGITLHELRESLTLAEAECLNGAGAHVFPFADVRDMGSLLQRAGFALPVTDSEHLNVTYSDILSLMKDVRGMGESNILSKRPRRALHKNILARAAEIYGARFGLENGRIPANFEIIHMSGWAPSPNQPKALRPGSAKARLANALKTSEQKLPDKARP